jgi:signal transduction histidine kinase
LRRRLTLAVVVLTVGTLLVTGTVTVVLTVHDTRQQTRAELVREATLLSATLQADSSSHGVRRAAALKRILAVLNPSLKLENSALLTVKADGVLLSGPAGAPVAGLPSGLDETSLDLAALPSGGHTSGVTRNVVYAAAAFTVTVHHLGATAVVHEVILLTRRPPTGIGGVLPLLLISSGVLAVVAVAVADRFGRRLVRPLQTAEAVTARIASGDLDARVGEVRETDPELRRLGTSINSMAASLAAAQGAQRQFLLSVSHELRTPLTSIQGFAEALEDGTTTDVGRAAGVIGSEARRLGRLVSDLLDLARLDAGQFSLRPGPLVLGPAVEGAVIAFEPAAADLGLALRLTVDGADFEVSADPDRLTQVVTNLVENALNHARSTVVVGAARSGASAVVWVEDDGGGIDPADRPHVFTRLFSSTARPGRRVGTGLGLAIVAELVGAMGGHVRADSPVGPSGGTRMVVTLPPLSAGPG